MSTKGRDKIVMIVKDAQAAVVKNLKDALTSVRNVKLGQLGQLGQLRELHIKEYDTAVPSTRVLQYP